MNDSSKATAVNIGSGKTQQAERHRAEVTFESLIDGQKSVRRLSKSAARVCWLSTIGLFILTLLVPPLAVLFFFASIVAGTIAALMALSAWNASDGIKIYTTAAREFELSEALRQQRILAQRNKRCPKGHISRPMT